MLSRIYSVFFDQFGLVVFVSLGHASLIIYQIRQGNKLLAVPSEKNPIGKNKKTTSKATTVFNLNTFKKWNLCKQCSNG